MEPRLNVRADCTIVFGSQVTVPVPVPATARKWRVNWDEKGCAVIQIALSHGTYSGDASHPVSGADRRREPPSCTTRNMPWDAPQRAVPSGEKRCAILWGLGTMP